MEQDLSHQQKGNKSKIRRMIMNIYVGNLSYDATDETIRQAFEAFGQVTSARIIKDKYNGQSRGFGFVEMLEQAQAQAAIKSLNGKELLGKQMSMNEARPRTDRGRSGGQGGPRGRSGYGSRGRY
jgi:RNA recognition motif-containing protein